MRSAGFAAGLILDVATLGTLGVTSLLLTLAGYWAGRYGETTGRSRAHAPLVAAVAATVFIEVGGYALHSMLGEPVAARAVLVALPAAVLWNALLAYPVFALVRRLRRHDRARGARPGGRAACLTPPTASGATPRRASCRPIRASARRTG